MLLKGISLLFWTEHIVCGYPSLLLYFGLSCGNALIFWWTYSQSSHQEEHWDGILKAHGQIPRILEFRCVLCQINQIPARTGVMVRAVYCHTRWHKCYVSTSFWLEYFSYWIQLLTYKRSMHKWFLQILIGGHILGFRWYRWFGCEWLWAWVMFLWRKRKF